ncbi:hypothetical protein FRB95_012323 [Tulasnella sp. JGI-2019a]|nr:hypothetical protein FRB95_012323 [Tulasnella sp. JGI-2019a]
MQRTKGPSSTAPSAMRRKGSSRSSTPSLPQTKFTTPPQSTSTGHQPHHSWSHQQPHQFQQQISPYIPLMPGLGSAAGHMMRFANSVPDFLTEFPLQGPFVPSHGLSLQHPHHTHFVMTAPGPSNANYNVMHNHFQYNHQANNNNGNGSGPLYHHDYVPVQQKPPRQQQQHQPPKPLSLATRVGQKRRGTLTDQNDMELPSSPPKKARLQHQPMAFQQDSKSSNSPLRIFFFAVVLNAEVSQVQKVLTLLPWVSFPII